MVVQAPSVSAAARASQVLPSFGSIIAISTRSAL
jgi:hypothetical protein